MNTQLDAVDRAISFVETHLMKPISVADMAVQASYSLYHFCRVFGKSTRHSPHDYLIRRRMTKAVERVIDSEHKIIDIAMDYQFESHEGFTRAFGRIFNISPSQARQQKQIDRFRTLPRLTFEHLLCLKQQDYLPVTIRQMTACSANESYLDIHLSNISTLPAHQKHFWIYLEHDTQVSENKSKPYQVAEFVLSGDLSDLRQILDWVLHAWLFFAPYQLLEPRILVRRETEIYTHLLIPII
ncbi:MAG: helix-turn-helix transcriptional regulator [Chloroflexota bacterium]